MEWEQEEVLVHGMVWNGNKNKVTAAIITTARYQTQLCTETIGTTYRKVRRKARTFRGGYQNRSKQQDSTHSGL
jgi:hypothetical protein